MTSNKGESVWSGFYKKPISERQQIVAKERKLDATDIALLNKDGPLPLATADTITENVIGTFALPFSVAPYFLVNGKEYVVPMVLEEPSVVAAASNAAKMAREKGGFATKYSGSVMTGQIQIVKVTDAAMMAKKLETDKTEILAEADKYCGHLKPYGGGMKGMQARHALGPTGQMLIVEFHINVIDAMGANAVNTVMEKMAPYLEKKTGGKVRLRILTNLCLHRIVSSSAVWSKEALGGEEAVDAIMDAWAFAMADNFRRATHHKGIMNGMDAVAIATGNDWRAVEAGAHSYAALKGASITTYRRNADGDLEGSITLPLAVGTIGGSMKANPCAALGQKILGAKTSEELSGVMASVGLAQNLAALKALSTEGIQAGHMRLHARNIAASAGAKPQELDKVAEWMSANKKIDAAGAKEALAKLRSK
ncbi:3-hydroxy-3-methylglutaryl-coenzyme A reductase [uncultured archaeon]|nr:3-hydroxy-3-methylglutaryl-coenzyme A reductase [uncultured archaeon]